MQIQILQGHSFPLHVIISN